jgi:hypothetical protein
MVMEYYLVIQPAARSVCEPELRMNVATRRLSQRSLFFDRRMRASVETPQRFARMMAF